MQCNESAVIVAVVVPLILLIRTVLPLQQYSHCHQLYYCLHVSNVCVIQCAKIAVLLQLLTLLLLTAAACILSMVL
jgi:hypothetical protein